MNPPLNLQLTFLPLVTHKIVPIERIPPFPTLHSISEMEFFQTTPLPPQSRRAGPPGNSTRRAGARGHLLPRGIRRETRGQADGVPPRGPPSNGGRFRGGEACGLRGDEGREGAGEEAAGQLEA